MKHVIAGLLAVTITGCSGWLKTHAGPLTTDGANEVKCILEHVGEPAEQIGLDCAINELEIVRDVVSAHKAAIAKAVDAK